MKNALVIGAGRSGLAAARLLLEKGVNVALFDDQPASQLRYVREFEHLDHENLKSHFADSHFVYDSSYDVVILSPGVSLNHHLVLDAQERKIPILNEIEIALLFRPTLKIIGITGTNGKSTATVMMESILKAAGLKACAGGNLGIPLCDLVMKHEDFDHLVLELSSFQLETLQRLELDEAIILNITPDHLDRYDSMESYEKAKFRIIDLVKPNGHVVLNDNLKSLFTHAHHEVHFFSSIELNKAPWDILKKASLRGIHNQENALAVAKGAHALGISFEAILVGLNNFKPLEFRCQTIACKKGLTFVNDSKGTTVVAVEKALSSVSGPIHLLLGGQDKGENFAPLATFSQIAGFYIYGQSQAKIFDELGDVRAHRFSDLSHAFHAAVAHAQPGSAIVLSPGCASYDQFADYAERGRMFNRLVDGLE